MTEEQETQADADRKVRFVELRAEKMSLGDVAKELQLDIVTAWEWDKELAQEVEALRARRRPPRRADPNKPVVCPKCGERSFPGQSRCDACRARLRPLLLSVVVVVVPIVLVLQTISHFRELPAPGLAGLVIASAQAVWNVIAIGVLLCLGYGSHRAWIAVQVMQGLGVLSWYALGIWLTRSFEIGEGMMDVYWRVVIMGTLLVILWWTYLHTPRVKAFCSRT